MKLVIISDTHFGDETGTLVDIVDGQYQRSSKYEKFIKAAGSDNDFLVLSGDILDFSIKNYAAVYNEARAFFQFVQQDKIARAVIYVPGNHDFSMWNTVEYQIRIIYPISKGCPARDFRWSAPGLIDDRTVKGDRRGFYLPTVVKGAIDPEAEPHVKMFLNSLTKNEDGSGEETRFYFAYPNLYIVTDKESVLVTHGHYLEPYWTLSGEWVMKIAQEDLKIGDAFDLWELVAVNQPLCQLACTGIGQAGPLTALVQKTQLQIKSGELKDIKKYLNRLDNEIDRRLDYKFLDPREWLSDTCLNNLKKQAIELLGNYKDTRYSEEFIHKKEVLNRFRDFYDASRVEIATLNESYGLDIPEPRKIIFGHTHCPISWGSPQALKAKVSGGGYVTLYNTGGWLMRKTEAGAEFCGAEVFTYDSKGGFKSITIN
ncbi:MAG: metallophosphoesterase [candidate division Zixibacteria bacterium]|nr:metallophosphoesterase [candidate division Zixibacteria bacterium]